MRQSLKVMQDSYVSQLLRRCVTPYSGESSELDPLMDLVGDKSFVLIGEASHGTHEFYKTRIELTKRLIVEKGFTVVTAEADWPDSVIVNRFVKGQGDSVDAFDSLSGFQRFPTWLWRNADVLSFVEWLRAYNDRIVAYDKKVGFYGLDLYSLYRSAEAVVNYLQAYDPAAAERAKSRYACLSAFGDEQAYGYAASLGMTDACEQKVIAELVELQNRAAEFLERDGKVALDEYFFVEQNAIVVAKAQKYYREMFQGRMSTWNLRDRHMVETLVALKNHMRQNRQPFKVIVWAHNSHLGDASATQMSERGEYNVGQLIRNLFPDDCCLIGFTGYEGTVTAASQWGGPAERKNVIPGLNGSIEKLFHTIALPSFILRLREPCLEEALAAPRLERAIGVIYLPETERHSHYFFTRICDQFDAVIHFQETQAVEPLERTARWVAGEDRVEDTID